MAGDWTLHTQVQIIVLVAGITVKFGKLEIWIPPQVMFLAAVTLYMDSIQEIYKGSGGKDMKNEDKNDGSASKGSNNKIVDTKAKKCEEEALVGKLDQDHCRKPCNTAGIVKDGLNEDGSRVHVLSELELDWKEISIAVGNQNRVGDKNKFKKPVRDNKDKKKEHIQLIRTTCIFVFTS